MIAIQKEKADDCCVSPTEGYPWGTSISFEANMVNLLGLGGLPVGTKVNMSIETFITSVSMESDGEMCVRLQITAAEKTNGEAPAPSVSREQIMYGGE